MNTNQTSLQVMFTPDYEPRNFSFVLLNIFEEDHQIDFFLGSMTWWKESFQE